MGSVFKRGQTWWMKFKSSDGDWTAQGTSALTKAEAKGLLVEVERQVERKRLGLEPRTLNPERWNVGDLLRWWLDEYSSHHASHVRNESAIRVHLLGAAIAAKKLEHVAPADIEELLQSKQGDLGAGTINHLRATWCAPSTRRRSAASGSAPTPPKRSRRARSPRRW